MNSRQFYELVKQTRQVVHAFEKDRKREYYLQYHELVKQIDAEIERVERILKEKNENRTNY